MLVGVVVVVVAAVAPVSLSSSSVNLASSDCRESSAEETDSLSDVVSRDANVSPAVTWAPGTTATRGHLSRHLETGGGVVHGLDRPDHDQVAGDRGVYGLAHAIAPVARAARRQGCGPTGDEKSDDDGGPDDERTPSRSAPAPLRRLSHWTRHPFHRHRPPPNRPPKPPPPKPVVHVFPPVEVMRTVVAVTAPVLLAVPNALTQSPTATADDVVVWVCRQCRRLARS